METECEGKKTNPRENKQLFQSCISNTPEGRILIAGLTTTFLSIVFLTFSWFWKRELAEILIAMVSTDIAFGWIASMALGYTIGLSHIEIIPINMFIETTLVLLFYPLFVFSWKRIIVIRGLKNVMERIGKTAENSRNSIQKYGVLGLFLFVWVPFWMTGPVVGCAIGFLIGLRPLYNLGIVLPATYLAICCWAIVLGRIHNSVAAYGPFASIILLSILILFIVTGHFLLDRRSPQ